MRSPVGALVKAAARKPKKSDSEPPVPVSANRRTDVISILTGVGGSDTGRQVEAYKHSSPLFSAAAFNAAAVAQVQWRLFQTGDGRGRISGPDPRKEVVQHQALRVWNKPNAFMHGEFFREYSQLLVELTGLVYLVAERSMGIPTAMWPVRRDRITPIPDPDKYLLGYAYLPEDGGDPIPLGLDEVIPIQMVDPSDPLGGVSPVQPLLTDLMAAKLTSEWRENFFRNSANPGGIIQIEQDTNLSDEDFDELSARWDEQHRGTRNAHRVAIIERGKWIQNDQSLADMQMVEMRQDDRDRVFEGMGVSKSLLGVTEDVNFAGAKAAEYTYTKWHLQGKLSRWRDAANFLFLPMFSSANQGQYTFDFDSPIPSDWQADAETTKANAQAIAQLVLAGFDPADVVEQISGLTMKWIGLPGAAAQPAEQPQARSADVQRLLAQLNTWGSM